MIEIEKQMEPLSKVINEVYEAIFQQLPKFPKFSFTRAMITIWKAKVYSKIEQNLQEAINKLIKIKREEMLIQGKQKTEDNK